MSDRNFVVMMTFALTGILLNAIGFGGLIYAFELSRRKITKLEVSFASQSERYWQLSDMITAFINKSG